MDSRQGFIIHFPCEQDLIQLDLPPWYRYPEIGGIALLEISVRADELEVFRLWLQTAAVFDDLFQTDSCPLCCAYSTFGPLFRNLSE